MQSKDERIESLTAAMVERDRRDPMSHRDLMDFQYELRAILAEPNPPASDAGAEIVSMLADECSMGTINAELLHTRAREIRDRHQTRRVVVVELSEEEWNYLAECQRGGWFSGDTKAGVILEQAARKAYRAQHPQPTGGS